MRILCHGPHLSGVGHFVRTRAIARGLASAHDVVLTQGGRPLPETTGGREPARLDLPRLYRAAGRLSTDAGPSDVPQVLAERARVLDAAARRLRPDVVLIEHYPFSKWELEPEMAALIAAARAANTRVRIVCSLRDIVRKTRHEDAAPAAWEARVLDVLRERFDAVLVHADPAFTTLGDHFGAAAAVPVPVRYTGFVTEPPGARPAMAEAYAVASAGGSAGHAGFLRAAIEAFGRMRRGPATRLVVFPPPLVEEADLAPLRDAAAGAPVEVRAFSGDFSGWLAGAALSVSRAGYNTSFGVLRAGTPAVLVPDPVMSDQEPRAMRLAELGLATAVSGRDVDADRLAAAMESALARGGATPSLDLDGVAGTRAAIEAL